MEIPGPLCLEPDLTALRWDLGICIFTCALALVVLGPYFAVQTLLSESFA